MRCRTLYDCDADNHDELSFKEGEVIVVLREEEEEWWVSTTSPVLNIQCVKSGIIFIKRRFS